MNFLTLGCDKPDYTHPILQKYNAPTGGNAGLTQDQQIIKVVRALQSSAYASDVEKLRLYYQQKLITLQSVFQLSLSKYAVFNMPSGGLAAWIKLNEDLDVADAIPELSGLGLYLVSDNQNYDPLLPVSGIRLGIGTHTVEILEKAFEILAARFKLA